MLMITGASAGSTAGGVKILRVLVAVKVASRELRRLVNPRRIERIRMNDEFLEDEQVSLIIGMLMVWVLSLHRILLHHGPVDAGSHLMASYR